MNIKEFENKEEKVFLIRNIIEVRIPKKSYLKLIKKYPKEYIISFSKEKKIFHSITHRPLYYITKESGIPLLGYNAFGLIDRGTNLIQVRPITGCNLNCIFCSVDEGRFSRSRFVDYIVDVDYLVEEFEKISKFKGKNLEAHIDGQGEPSLYPYLVELIEGLNDLKEVSIISMQSNGIPLNKKIIDRLEGKLDRINLSISALDQKIANKLHGVKYPLKKILELAEYIANSKIDLLIAPVWVPNYNDEEITKIIEFALDLGAGKRFPPLGIQKYIPHKHGRRPKTTVMTFKEFYAKLKELEKEYDVNLILKPEYFGTEKRKRIPKPIRKGESYNAKIVLPGRLKDEKLCIVKNRLVSIRSNKRIGSFAKIKIIRDKDGIFFGKEI